MTDEIVRRTQARIVAIAIGICVGLFITIVLPILIIFSVNGDGTSPPLTDFAGRVIERAGAFLGVSFEPALLVCGIAGASVSGALVYLALERISRPKK